MAVGKHATEEKRRIAESGLILRCLVGSGVHGLSIKSQDDRDEMGVTIEPPDPADQLRVWCWYDGYGGGWQVGAGQVIEDVTMASWPVSFGQHASGYSAVLTIDAPDGTRLTNVKPVRHA